MASDSMRTGMINAIYSMGRCQGKSKEEIEKEIDKFLISLPKEIPFESATERMKPIIHDEEKIINTSSAIFCNPNF